MDVVPERVGAADPSGRAGMANCVPATISLQEQRPRTLKHGDAFALFDSVGDVLPGAGSPWGLFNGDTRHLSLWRLRIDGTRPLLLTSTVRDDNASLRVDLTAPDRHENGHLVLSRDTVHLTRNIFLFEGACHERLTVRSFDTEPREVVLSWHFAADFADIFEVRGHERARRGKTACEIVEGAVLFDHLGLDGVRRQTEIRFDPPPGRLGAGSARYEMRLDPDERFSIFVRVLCERPRSADGAWNGRRYFSRLRSSRRALRQAGARAARITTSNEVVNEVLSRSLADLRMLTTDTPHGPYPHAGIPWFGTAFGRDGLITALQMLWLDPAVAAGVLRFLAREQARTVDPAIDAEPGKILHESRTGELARLGEVPFGRYYGSIDSTPLFVLLAGLYVERTDDRAMAAELWSSIEAALDWMDRWGDRDGDGFLEYRRENRNGLINQGWKDSSDSIFDDNGRLADGPVALVEVQAYAYGARQHAARLARLLGHERRARQLEAAAERLRTRFSEAFWCEELNSYALGLDGAKRKLRVRSSNAGHALLTGLAPEEQAERIAHGLLSPAFFSGWGVRTLAEGEPRYNPMSYHNGSVWPHDNALLAMGLARYRHTDVAVAITEGMLDAASYMDLRRLPELYCGFRRLRATSPIAYPVACAPQAWAAAAPFALLAACIGIQFDLGTSCVRLVRPRLPRGIDELLIRGLRCSGGELDLLLRRHGRDVAVNVPRLEGTVRVEVVL